MRRLGECFPAREIYSHTELAGNAVETTAKGFWVAVGGALFLNLCP
ncbi:hypothetical protein Q1M64_05605 (plasmid) [Sinorhizobium meliloti]|nr:hypothetical protein Q1M63_01820 [Sinorhizobium meliloti]WKL39072.1 hypothetical protein Q1M64_05605 [Sinorhizobium meliloti]